MTDILPLMRKGADMNFQKLADSFHLPTCIISVQKKDDGGYGEIRLKAANPGYVYPIEHPAFPTAPDLPGLPEIFQSTNKFIPDSLYTDYYPLDSGFEDICYRSAVKKIPIHTYVHMNDLDIWFDIFCLPLDYEDGDICYCAYTAHSSSPEEIGISSSQSNTASEDVIKTCIKLHSTNDFNKTMESVIHDIRLICKAEVCTIILADINTGICSVLAASIDDNSNITRITKYSNFNTIALSWFDTIADKDCLIIREEKDWDYIKRINRLWYDNLRDAGVTSIVFFPLRYDDEILGFIWATNFDTSNTMRIKETLELTTFFISSKLSSYKMVEYLKKLSYTDQLTELPNRIACTEMINSLIRKKESFTVVSIDINGFKSINDTLGFDTGNKVLIEIAARWKAIADANLSGTHDHIARMGGDEFVLIIQNYRSDEEILKTIMQYESILGNRLTVDDCDFYITASFGYSVFPNDASTSDSLITFANAAMREVKRINSSNHILRFASDMLRLERTLEIEHKLRAALENDSVFYHLQPQFDINHKLRGFEALARMTDADGKFISPGEFIPVAEKVGLVDKIDGVVFRKSASFIGNIIRETGSDIILSVNVSVRHLMKNDFLDEVKEVLNSSGLPSSQLEIEITESIMIDSAEKALKCIDELHRMGIKIAIDDFGTGYSSLSYLNNFPANILKIDKSFIDKMNSGESSKQYVAAIISIGHIMGFEVISEGVEEEDQLKTLREVGCDYIQGYIWGKPMPKEEAEKLIINSANSD